MLDYQSLLVDRRDSTVTRFKKSHILIVDDNPSNVLTLEAVLKPLDQDLVYAYSGEEALKYVLKHDFSVILMDAQMPKLDGFETVKLIRMRDKSRYTPIIFLSAFHQDEIDIAEGYKIGAVDYILKPINPNILYSKVQVFVDLFTKSIQTQALQYELKKRLQAEKLVAQHQHQLELAHKTQITALEAMSSALAHELNQPLAAIANYARGCIRRIQTEGAENLMYALEQTAHLAERAGKIIHRINNFARKGKLYYELLHINDLISGMSHLVTYEIKDPDINIQYELLDGPLWVMVDKIQLEQVILNLLRNGIEAMGQPNQSEKKQLTVQTGLITENTNKQVVINIMDTGPGFLPEIAPKLFELYCTTKPHGMGMGLSICRTIIEAHRGSISAKTNPAGGAWLQITLPWAKNV